FSLANSFSLKNYLSNYNGDYLFYLLTWIIAGITNNVMIFYVILHLIFLIILIKGLREINGNSLVVLTLFIFLSYNFYYSYTLNAIRQGLALSLMILAIGYLIKNKGWRFLTTLVLASLFHASSVLFSLMLVFIYKFRGLKVKHSLIVYFITSFFFFIQLCDILV